MKIYLQRWRFPWAALIAALLFFSVTWTSAFSQDAQSTKHAFSSLDHITEKELSLESLSSQEMEDLTTGKAIIRSLDSHTQIRLDPSNSAPAGKEVLENLKGRFVRLKPNFLAEAMFILPVQPGSERRVLEEVKLFLQEVQQFEEIPYYSEEYDKYFPLFDDIELQGQDFVRDGTAVIHTNQLMKPFKRYEALYRYELGEDYFLYTSYNETSIKYKMVRGVKPENMQTGLLVQAYEGYLFCYGLGGADAFTFFGLFGERLDTALTGRIESFFNWFHTEFIEPRLAEMEN